MVGDILTSKQIMMRLQKITEQTEQKSKISLLYIEREDGGVIITGGPATLLGKTFATEAEFEHFVSTHHIGVIYSGEYDLED